MLQVKWGGGDYLKEYNFKYEVIGETNKETNSDDTKNIAKLLVAKKVEAIIFVGGDGTARDVLDAVGMNVPVIAIPSGVKMFSSAFVFSANAAAEMINTFGNDFLEKEVLDIDEDAFRENILAAKYYGTVLVPNIEKLLQGKKAASNTQGRAVDKKKEVAKYVIEKMEDDCLYILGPGTTVKEITTGLGVSKTLLGVDALFKHKIVGQDVGEKEILKLIDKYNKVKIIVTPIGGNGFIFGRGSRQISSEVLKKVGKENLIIVSTIDKVGSLECLHIDSGDYEVDKTIKGSINVIIDYNEEIVMEVVC
ncbi:MAG: ATP-NAD kinase family protein [Peptostreptococcaceae bacterium]|nr:ATP-NAD kinase family protein [Peptostreptococcaceae bacterium]